MAPEGPGGWRSAAPSGGHNRMTRTSNDCVKRKKEKKRPKMERLSDFKLKEYIQFALLYDI